MTKALISIDYTYDFVADKGKLTAGAPAQAISEAIAQVTQQAYDNGDYIFFAIDGHDEGDAFHPESNLFPPHNLRGTSGRDLYGPLGEFYQKHQENPRVFWLDKRHYSAFFRDRFRYSPAGAPSRYTGFNRCFDRYLCFAYGY